MKISLNTVLILVIVTIAIVNLDAGQDMGSVKVENIVIERLPQRSQ